MKPFLLLQSRPETEAADNEYETFRRFGGLEPGQLIRIDMNDGGLPPINLDNFSGVILGGGPSNITDTPDHKTPAQLIYEPQLLQLLEEIAARDFPFLGACLGVGFLGTQLGGTISRKYGEPAGPVTISLTPEAISDPLVADLPSHFTAFVGHKEACEILPPGAVLLASSATCPIQMFRFGRNVYATQFHPELDTASFILRITIYQHHGYFAPHELDVLIDKAHSTSVTVPDIILRRFVERYASIAEPSNIDIAIINS